MSNPNHVLQLEFQELPFAFSDDKLVITLSNLSSIKFSRDESPPKERLDENEVSQKGEKKETPPVDNEKQVIVTENVERGECEVNRDEKKNPETNETNATSIKLSRNEPPPKERLDENEVSQNGGSKETPAANEKQEVVAENVEREGGELNRGKKKNPETENNRGFQYISDDSDDFQSPPSKKSIVEKKNCQTPQNSSLKAVESLLKAPKKRVPQKGRKRKQPPPLSGKQEVVVGNVKRGGRKVDREKKQVKIKPAKRTSKLNRKLVYPDDESGVDLKASPCKKSIEKENNPPQNSGLKDVWKNLLQQDAPSTSGIGCSTSGNGVPVTQQSANIRGWSIEKENNPPQNSGLKDVCKNLLQQDAPSTSGIGCSTSGNGVPVTQQSANIRGWIGSAPMVSQSAPTTVSNIDLQASSESSPTDAIPQCENTEMSDRAVLQELLNLIQAKNDATTVQNSNLQASSESDQTRPQFENNMGTNLDFDQYLCNLVDPIPDADVSEPDPNQLNSAQSTFS